MQKKFYRNPNKKKSKSGLYFCCKKCQDSAYKIRIIKTGPRSKFENLSVLERKKLFNYNKNRICKDCGKPIYNKNKSGRCASCCRKNKYKNITIEQRKKFSQQAKERLLTGKMKPWQSRNVMSYPEKFFKKVLELNHINFEGPNYVVKQIELGVPNCKPFSCYFLDFKIGNIDLEIDGKQHNYEEQKEKDKIRDKYLRKAGYIVYRIKWKSINSESGKKYIKEEIEKLLKFIRGVA